MSTSKTFSVVDILSRIKKDFSYNAVSGFKQSPVYDECLKILSNSAYLTAIVLANDLGISPVKPLIRLFRLRNPSAQSFSDSEKQCIGLLMKFLFTEILEYDENLQKSRQVVNEMNVKTGTVYPSNVGVLFNFVN